MVYITFNKSVPLETNPSYTDKRFETEQTVFGKAERGLSYNYSDRLWQWDYGKAEEASKVASASGQPLRSCAWYEAYLSTYFGKRIEIKHIIAGINPSNGFAYCVFGYREKGK